MSTRRIACFVAALCGAGVLLAATPATTPRMPDGRPDLNGVWDNGGGIDFLKPQTTTNGSVCVTGCAPAAPAAAAPAATPAPAPVGTARPKYRPEFTAKVDDLKKRQQKEDPVLRCQ